MHHIEILGHILPYLPFIGAAVVGSNNFNFGTLISRILETAIIGAIVLYANVQTINTKLESARSDISECVADHKVATLDIHNHAIELTALKAEVQALRREASKYHKGME
jgi:large-conductance mechanosensitive channel